MSTLFIDHLPHNFSSHDLRMIFSNQGHIIDAYVPKIQRRRVHGRFGFIEVQAREQGDRLIQETDGKVLGHQVIKVQWAKFPKRPNRSMKAWHSFRRGEQIWNWERGYSHNKTSNGGFWRPKRQATVTTMSGELEQHSKTAKVIQIEKVQDNLEWLGRSLTCVSDTSRDIGSLRSLINNAFHEKILVRDLGKFKFLLTMESKELKEKLLNDDEERLKQWFSSISDWAEEDVCQTRRLWLEIVSVPIHIWNEQNIRKIAENWGDVVFVEEESSKQESFASAKVVIDTLSVNPIDDEAIVQINDKGFRVSVFEAKTEFTIFHTGPLDEEVSSPSLIKYTDKRADMGSNDAMVARVNRDRDDRQKEHIQDEDQDGREDDQSLGDRCNSNLNLNLNSNQTRHVGQPWGSLNGNINAMADVEKSQQLHVARVDGERSEGLLGETPLTEIDDERVNGHVSGGRICGDAISASSSTKTKSAQLSGNGYSEEMEKIFRQGPAIQVESNQPVDHGNELNLSDSPHVQHESDLLAPPGFGANEDSVPPGFEGTLSPDVSPVRKVKGTKRFNGQSVKRVTRSQVKQSMKHDLMTQSKGGRIVSSKQCVEGSPQGSESAKTPESIAKIAREALEVGKILGVKVITHDTSVFKRKINRATRAARSRQ